MNNAWQTFKPETKEEYFERIRKEHAHLTDEQLRANPNGIYNGAGRNQRWRDEIKRRGLI